MSTPSKPTLILDTPYMSSFTPKGKIESPKECPNCKKFLQATRFKSSMCKRNGIDGISRNSKCRQCESRKTNEKKHERTSGAEIAIDELNHKFESIMKDFVVIKTDFAIIKSKIKELQENTNCNISAITNISDKLNIELDANGHIIVSKFGQKKDIDKEQSTL